METRTVLAPGTTVDLGNGLEGRVLDVCLKTQGEQYRVAWWNGKTRVVEWLEAEELSPVQSTKTALIGFVQK